MKEEYRDTPYTITEWQWLELQLKLFSLKFSGEKFSMYFEFPDEDFPRDGKNECAIFAEQTQALMNDNSSKEE